MAGSVEKLYSDVMLEIAREDGSAEELDRELDTLCGIVRDNPELTAAMGAPTITDKEKVTILENIFKGRVSETTLNFLCVLAEKNRFGHLSGIAEEFRKGYYKMNGISEVTVTTAVPLKDNAREKLLQKLKKMYGGTIVLIEKVDPGIIGGMMISCGGSMMDGSVKTKLGDMHKQIKDMIAG